MLHMVVTTHSAESCAFRNDQNQEKLSGGFAALGDAASAKGVLEGLGVTPDGRSAIFFGLWAFIAGFALMSDPATGAATRT